MESVRGGEFRSVPRPRALGLAVPDGVGSGAPGVQANGSTLRSEGPVTRVDALFTQRELDVMGVLWDDGSATVAEARDRIEARVGDALAYTTILTILRTLEHKGFVGHQVEGRAHRYLPLVSREEAQVSHLRRMVRKLYRDDPVALVLRAEGTFAFSSADRARIAGAFGAD